MLPYQLKIVSLMAISRTRVGNVQHSTVLVFKVIASSRIGWLLHYHFFYA